MHAHAMGEGGHGGGPIGEAGKVHQQIIVIRRTAGLYVNVKPTAAAIHTCVGALKLELNYRPGGTPRGPEAGGDNGGSERAAAAGPEGGGTQHVQC
jgi:hypothetical protein